MTAYFGQWFPGDRIGAMGLPPFHSFGMTMQLYLPLAYLATVAVYPPQTITNQRAVPIVPTSDNILDCARRTHCKALVAVPTFLEQWAASTEAVEALAKLDRVVGVVSTSIDGTSDHSADPWRRSTSAKDWGCVVGCWCQHLHRVRWDRIWLPRCFSQERRG